MKLVNKTYVGADKDFASLLKKMTDDEIEEFADKVVKDFDPGVRRFDPYEEKEGDPERDMQAQKKACQKFLKKELEERAKGNEKAADQLQALANQIQIEEEG